MKSISDKWDCIILAITILFLLEGNLDVGACFKKNDFILEFYGIAALLGDDVWNLSLGSIGKHIEEKSFEFRECRYLLTSILWTVWFHFQFSSSITPMHRLRLYSSKLRSNLKESNVLTEINYPDSV